jgi:hypothetical protein
MFPGLRNAFSRIPVDTLTVYPDITITIFQGKADSLGELVGRETGRTILWF